MQCRHQQASRHQTFTRFGQSKNVYGLSCHSDMPAVRRMLASTDGNCRVPRVYRMCTHTHARMHTKVNTLQRRLTTCCDCMCICSGDGAAQQHRPYNSTFGLHPGPLGAQQPPRPQQQQPQRAAQTFTSAPPVSDDESGEVHLQGTAGIRSQGAVAAPAMTAWGLGSARQQQQVGDLVGGAAYAVQQLVDSDELEEEDLPEELPSGLQSDMQVSALLGAYGGQNAHNRVP